MKDVALISRLKFVKTDFSPTEVPYPTFRIDILGNKIVTYWEINQAIFDSRLITDVKSGDEGQSMSDLDFKESILQGVYDLNRSGFTTTNTSF